MEYWRTEFPALVFHSDVIDYALDPKRGGNIYAGASAAAQQACAGGPKEIIFSTVLKSFWFVLRDVPKLTRLYSD